MVIHEYKCVGCGDTRDYFHAMNENPSSCSNCGGPGSGLVKKFSVPNIGSSKGGVNKFINKGCTINPHTDQLTTCYSTREIRRDDRPGEVTGDFVLEDGTKLSNCDMIEFPIKG